MKLMVIADVSVLPIALHTDSANPYEVKLMQAKLNEIVTVGHPQKIIGDRAYDSDPLANALASQGIEKAPRKMVGYFADIKDDGKSNAFLRGLTNSEN